MSESKDCRTSPWELVACTGEPSLAIFPKCIFKTILRTKCSTENKNLNQFLAKLKRPVNNVPPPLMATHPLNWKMEANHGRSQLHQVNLFIMHTFKSLSFRKEVDIVPPLWDTLLIHGCNRRLTCNKKSI